MITVSKPKFSSKEAKMEFFSQHFDVDLETGACVKRGWRGSQGISMGYRYLQLTGGGRKNRWAMSVSAHRFVFWKVNGFLPEEVDHINMNKLDNRPSNLRQATKSQNRAYTPLRLTNRSGYKGVSFVQRLNKWAASIQVNKKLMYLGVFSSPEEAARAYDRVAYEKFGKFAVTNADLGLLKETA